MLVLDGYLKGIPYRDGGPSREQESKIALKSDLETIAWQWRIQANAVGIKRLNNRKFPNGLFSLEKSH